MVCIEIVYFYVERECYEEIMKKVFMCGVCVLNLEVMSMFREGEEGGWRFLLVVVVVVNDNGVILYFSIYKIWFIVFGIIMDSDFFKNFWIKNLILEVLDLFYLKMMLRYIRELFEMLVNFYF